MIWLVLIAQFVIVAFFCRVLCEYLRTIRRMAPVVKMFRKYK